MSTPPATSRAEAMLGELASQALEMARDLKEAALAAESADDKAKLTHAWAATGRAMRQSLALQTRLGREIRRADREEKIEVARDHAARRPQRAIDVRRAVAGMIWNEYEAPDDRELLLEALDGYLSDSEFDEDFTQLPLALVLDHVRQTLGMDDEDEELLAPSPSPPAGEGGLRSGPDEGSLKPLGEAEPSARRGERSKTPHPSPTATPSPARGEGFRSSA